METLKEYKKESGKEDKDGKILYGFLLNEVKSMRRDREDIVDIVDIVVRCILDDQKGNVMEICNYLRQIIDK